jgi:hypothetical protein
MRQNNVARNADLNSTELLFYRFINALAYSKFADFIVADVEEKTQDKNVKTVKDFYQDFTENETEFSNMFGKELHQKIVLIIDEFCQEKLKEFLRIGASGSCKNDVDEGVTEFFNNNIENVNEICSGYKKNIIKNLQKRNLNEEGKGSIIRDLQRQQPCYSYLKIFIENLQKENPQKLQELIDFEIDKKTLKESSNNIKYVVGEGDLMVPATTFLINAKEASKLKRFGQERVVQNNFCAIS